MSCCGKNRQQWTESRPAQPRQARPPGTTTRVTLEYTGATSMTVISPLTGRQYTFVRNGARVEIDPRDRQYLIGIPHLRAVA
jgi:hypothetical protein